MLRSLISVDSSQTMVPDVATPIEHPTDPELLQSVEEVVRAILDFMEIRYKWKFQAKILQNLIIDIVNYRYW